MKKKSIYELMTFNLRALFHGRLMLFFKKSASISDYIHFCDSKSLLTTLTTLFRKTSLKMLSLETTLTTLIYIKNSFFTDYADNDDIQENMKNSFITGFDDYLVFNTRWEMISSFTTLTTLIYWLHWLCWYIGYIVYADILTTLTTLIYWLHWLRW